MAGDTEEQPLPAWSSAVEKIPVTALLTPGWVLNGLPPSMFYVQISVKYLRVQCICAKYHNLERAEGG